MKLHPATLFSVAVLASSLGLLNRAAAPFVESFRGKAFAWEVAEREGFGAWQVTTDTQYHDQVRLVFRNPEVAGSFADVFCEFDGQRWQLSRLNKDWRP